MATVEQDTTPSVSVQPGSLILLLTILGSIGIAVWQLHAAANRQPRPVPPLQAFVWLGIAVTLLVVERNDVAPRIRQFIRILQHHVDTRLLLAGIINVAGAAYVATSTAVPAGFLVAVWCFGLILYVAAFVRRDDAANLRRLLRRPGAWALFGMLLIGLYLRWRGLDGLPWPMAEDEGAMALEAVRFLSGRSVSPFGVGWPQHPNLFFYLQSFGIRLFGWNLLGVRIVSAVAGALTVVPVFLLADELFDRTIAWTAAALLLVLSFHVHYSRIAINTVMDSFFGAAALWALLRATRTRRPLWWAVTGVLLGGGLYFYGTFRIAFVLAALWIILTIRLVPEEWDGQWLNLAWMLGGIVLTILPFARAAPTVGGVMLRSAYQPGIVGSGELLQMTQEGERGLLETVLRRSYRAALGLFALNDRTYLYEPARPLLNVVSRVLMLLGIGRLLAIWHDRRAVWLGVWLLAPIVVDGFIHDPPTSPRLVFLVPALVIVIALGVIWFARCTRKLLLQENKETLDVALSVVVIGVVAWLNLSFYFTTYLPGPYYANQNMEIASEAGRLIAEQSSDTYVYFYGAPRVYFGHGSLQFLGRRPDGEDGPTPPGDFTFVHEDKPTLFIFLPEHTETVDAFRSQYPAVDLQHVRGRIGEPLFTWARLH